MQGLGAFATRHIPAGTRLIEYAGERLTPAQADARYFVRVSSHRCTPIEPRHVESTVLAAYRWQFIVSGMQHVHFRRLLSSMTTTAQCARLMTALQPLMQA